MTTREKESYILKELRKERKLNQGEVAEMLGVSAQAYQKYEYATAELTHENLVKLADFYKVSTDYLLGRTPVRTMNTLPIGALSEEEVKDIDEAIVSGYTQLSLDSRRAFIKMLEDMFGNIFEREDFGGEELADEDSEGSTA